MYKLYVLTALSLLITINAHAATTNTAKSSPITTFQLITNADAAYKQQQWEQVIALYQQLTLRNPYHGTYAIRLGEAHFNLGQYAQSTSAYTTALETGQSISEYESSSMVMFRIAQNYAHLKDKANALHWLIKARHTKQGILPSFYAADTVLKPLIGKEPEVQEEFPELPANISRDEGWRMDLKYLARLLELRHYAFDERVDKKDWDARVARLYLKIPTMTDQEIIAELMRLAALLQDGHTNVHGFLSKQFAPKNFIPVAFGIFSDGYFVKEIASDYAQAAGARIIAINHMPVEKMAKNINALMGHENPFIAKEQALILLQIPDFHAMADAPGSEGKTHLLLEKNNSRFEINIKNMDFNLRLIANKGLSIDQGISMGATSKSSKPLYLQDLTHPFWYHVDKSKKLMYFQWNNIINTQEQPLENFINHFFDKIDQESIKYLVVDLRHNDGGNSFLYKPFIQRLLAQSRINQQGHLFVILGRRTYSAAQNLASELDRSTHALFLGEPTGCSPNFVGEGNFFTLPYSGLTASVSNIYWQGGINSNDNRRWIAPDINTEISSEDYRQGRDPAMEEIYQIIAPNNN